MTDYKSKISLWVCTWLTVLFIFQLLADLSYGQTRAGSAFLKIPPGTRQQNMAGSMTAGLDAPYSLFANPAATGFLREWHLATSLNYWIADIYSLSALAAKRIHGNLNVALGLHVQGVDQFDATGGLAPPASAQDILLSASLGLPFEFPAGRISLGSNVKYLYSDLAQFSASGLIFDAGILYRTRRLPFLFGQKMVVSAGAAVNQLGPDLKFVLRPTPLPRMVKVGLGLNFGTHDGLQTQLTMDYQDTRDEDGRFALGAEIVNPFNSHWGRALTLRGGYAFTGNQDTRLVSKVTFGLSLSFDDYMNSEKRASNAVFLPRNSALRADAGLLSSSSFDNPVQGSLSLKPIGPERFDFHENTDLPGAMRVDEKRPRFSFRPGSAVFLSWERTQDPDLFDDVSYVVIGTRNDRPALQTLIGKIGGYELDLRDLDAWDGFVLSTSSGDTIPFFRLAGSGDLLTGRSQPRRFYLMPDITDRKDLSVALGPSMPGDYYWTVAAFDVHNGHVRFAGRSGQNIVHFKVAGAPARSILPLRIPTPGIRVPDSLDTDLTIKIETSPPVPNILFKSDKVRVATLDQCSRLILKAWAEYLNKLPGEQTVRIAGHADITGNHVSNGKLAERRAENIRQFLIKEGINADRLIAVGYSDTVSLPREQFTREKWLALNRRVELKTTPSIRIENNGALAADAIRVKVSGHTTNVGLTGAACASQLHEGVTLLDTMVDLPPRANLSLPIKDIPIRVESLCAFVDTDSILIETDESNNVSVETMTPDSLELIYPDEEVAELRMIVSRDTVDSGTAEIVVAKLWYEHEGCRETWAFETYPIVQFKKGVHLAELIRDGAGSSNGLAPSGAPRHLVRKIVISKFEPGDAEYSSIVRTGLVTNISPVESVFLRVFHRLELLPQRAHPVETGGHGSSINQQQGTEVQREVTVSGDTVIFRRLPGDETPVEIRLKIPLNENTPPAEKISKSTLLAWIERLQDIIIQSSLADTVKERFEDRSTVLEREVQKLNGTGPDILIDIRQKIANLEIDLNLALQSHGYNAEQLTLLAWLTMLGDQINQIKDDKPEKVILRDSLRVLRREVIKAPRPSPDRTDSLGDRIANLANIINDAGSPPDSSDPIPTWAWLLLVLAAVSALSLVPVRAVQDYGRQDVRLRSASIIKTAPEEAPLSADSEGTGGPDDLQRIEGIGPEIFDLLTAKGITTFAALAQMTPEDLQAILEAGDLKGKNPESWPEQAKLAAQRRWRKLDEWQEKHKHGVKDKKN